MNTEKAHTFAHHLHPFFSHIPLKIHQKRKKPLPFNLKSLTNSNPCSAGYIGQKFKPSSTTQATTSSWAKYSIVHKINEALETKQYCSAAFLDISQAFNRVWHTGLLHKLQQFLPLSYYLILKSYLHNRHFQVKVQDSCTPPPH
jgi:hypothetical protein